jgi:hypothetical protein
VRDPVVLPFPYTPDTPVAAAERKYQLALIHAEEVAKRYIKNRSDQAALSEMVRAEEALMEARRVLFYRRAEAEGKLA